MMAHKRSARLGRNPRTANLFVEIVQFIRNYGTFNVNSNKLITLTESLP